MRRVPRWCILGLLLWLAWAPPVAAADHRPPTVHITAPTTSSSYGTTTASLTLKGTAHDVGGSVRQVTWRTDRGGSGIATGTTQWTFGLTVPAGTTQVTVQARDATGNLGTDVLTITLLGTPPRTVTLAWEDTNTAGEAFQMERCQAAQCTTPCAMVPVAAIAPEDRTWTDTQVVAGVQYHYRLAMTLGGHIGPYSNITCTP